MANRLIVMVTRTHTHTTLRIEFHQIFLHFYIDPDWKTYISSIASIFRVANDTNAFEMLKL